MDKKSLIGVSILAVVLLVLGSLSNVVGYQSVHTSQQNIIKERINQRELLFQTIVDVANNKEIQRIILKSQMSQGIFSYPRVVLAVTKNQLNQLFILGSILCKSVSKSRIHSIVGKYQFFNQEMQKETKNVIQKNSTLNREITLLSNSRCDCETVRKTERYFPILCEILAIICVISSIFPKVLFIIFCSALISAIVLNCTWTQP